MTALKKVVGIIGEQKTIQVPKTSSITTIDGSSPYLCSTLLIIGGDNNRINEIPTNKTIDL